MNKTINVNIGGRIFSVEEDAFAQLEKYLRAIRASFEGHQSADEIISDIELRVSELFAERINESKQVIVIQDVEAVIAIMGKPEDYLEDEDEDEREFTKAKSSKKYEKRIFRDPDGKIIFGVCGGLSAYLGWDPIILRAIFVLTTFVWGTGPLIYIILALIIPKAKTTAEKLQMKGEPVTVDNISKKVNESFTGMKDDIKEFGEKHDINSESVNSAGKQIGDVIGDFFEALGKFLRIILRVLGKIVGILFFIAGAFGLMAIVTSLIGIDSFAEATGDREFMEVVKTMYTESPKKGFFMIGSFLTAGIPLIAMLLIGIRLLFSKIKYSGVIAISMVLLWMVGMGFLTYSGADLIRHRDTSTEFTQTLPLELDSSIDTLTLDIEGADLPRIRFRNRFMEGSIFYEGGVTIPWADSTNVMYVGKNRITVRQSAGKKFLLEVEKYAKGATEKEALMNAREIISHHEVSADSLKISPYFVLGDDARLLSQRTRYTLYVPIGKAVHFATRSEDIIYDIPNVSYTYDRDMIGKTWVMTEEGLKCTTCQDDNEDTEEDDVDVNIESSTIIIG
ncbi:MAG: PspC domain-containing protein [Bacteroidota bacterium]